LNVARNRALQEAQGEVVVFNDDDAAPEADWLSKLLRNFNDPRVLCVTGLTLPLELETPAQECFEQQSPFGRGFARRIFDGTVADPLAVSQVGAGANMALRKAVLTTVGAFDEALDAGTPTRSGGDHEMFYRILRHGFRIVYDPEAISWHRHRRSWQELEDTLYGYGVGVYSYWTRSLLVEHEWRTLLHASFWLLQGQLPGMVRSLLGRPGAMPLRLAQAELRGCLAGPRSYLRSRSARRPVQSPRAVEAQ
jgi:GT2 family glycosyltransferase